MVAMLKIERLLFNFDKTSKFSLFKKKFLIELVCVSPIPSILVKFSILLFSANLKKFSADFKCLAISFAFSCPICLIPNE